MGARLHISGYPRQSREARLATKREVVSYAHFSTGHHAVLNHDASGKTDLRRQHDVTANAGAVRHLDEVIDLGAGADPRFAKGGTVDRGIGANLDVVLDHDDRGLRNLLVGTIRSQHEAEAVGPNNGTIMEQHAVANNHPLTNGRIGVHGASGTDDHIVANRDVREYLGAVADPHPFSDHGTRTNRDVQAQDRRRRDHRAGMDTRNHCGCRREQSEGAGKGQIGITGPQRGLRSRRAVEGDNYRAGSRASEGGKIAAVHAQREILWRRVSKQRYATDLDIGRPLEAALQPSGEVAERHGPFMTISRTPQTHPLHKRPKIAQLQSFGDVGH
jgi:hypothetical protein